MIIYYLAFINFISFIIFGFDKLMAIKHKYRIPENFLLLLSLIGGCYGSFLAMLAFRHKIRKYRFIILIPSLMFIWFYILRML